jgi:hypothetical protein
MMKPSNPAGGSLAEVVTGFGPGSQIAGYRLEEQVGQGGMAVVFRARDERLGRLVALKILAPALAADEAFRQRFVRESRAAAAVDDPHIVPVFEAGEAQTGEHRGVLFIAMRYVPGGDVRALMRRSGPLPPGRAVWIISQVASALDAAHAAGLVHRDVKPANMLVDGRAGRPDHVYLSDFGLSKGKLAASELTGAGQFLGTVDYISPEQIEGKPVDGRADEYALACAAFELLAGTPPFRRDEALAVMYAQLSEPPPLLASRRPGLPRAADQVFARALAKAPAQRYASCREFADALRVAFGVAPYDSGPGVIPVAGHLPAQIVGMSAVAAADMPTGERDVPAAAGHPAGPRHSGPGARDQGQPARSGGRRRTALATLSGAGVLALTGITAAVIMASPPTHRSASSSTPAKAHPVTATPTVQQPVTMPPATHHPATPAAARPVRPASAPSPTFVVASPPPPTHPVTPSPAPTHSVAPTPSATPTYSAAPTPPPGY